MTNHKYREGDRLVRVSDSFFHDSLGVRKGETFVVDRIGRNIAGESLYCRDGWMFGLCDDHVVLESIYNSKLYKLLNEEDHA